MASAPYWEEDLLFLLRQCSCHPLEHPSCAVADTLFEHHGMLNPTLVPYALLGSSILLIIATFLLICVFASLSAILFVLLFNSLLYHWDRHWDQYPCLYHHPWILSGRFPRTGIHHCCDCCVLHDTELISVVGKS